MCTKEEVKQVIQEQGLVSQLSCEKVSNSIKQNVALMQKDIKDINDKQDLMLKKFDNFEKKFVSKIEFKPFRDKVTKVMNILWGVLIACAIIIAYYILIHVGLPTP